METERSSKLETWQNHYFVGQFVPLFQIASLFIGEPVLFLQAGEPLNFAANGGHAGNRIVIGDGDDIQPALACCCQPFQITDAGIFIIVRSRRVRVEVNFVPLPPACSLSRVRLL